MTTPMECKGPHGLACFQRPRGIQTIRLEELLKPSLRDLKRFGSLQFELFRDESWPQDNLKEGHFEGRKWETYLLQIYRRRRVTVPTPDRARPFMAHTSGQRRFNWHSTREPIPVNWFWSGFDRQVSETYPETEANSHEFVHRSS